MATGIKEIQDQISSLSETDFERFAQWFFRIHQQRAYQKRCSTKSGIPYQDLLKAFTRQAGGRPSVPRASAAASLIQSFYLNKRVKGCDPDGGEDVLMLEWGSDSKTEFRLAYIREVGPPPRPGRDGDIWHLTLELRFPMSVELERIKSGMKSFRSLREVEEKFYEYAVASKVGKATRKLKPGRVIVTYENVE